MLGGRATLAAAEVVYLLGILYHGTPGLHT